MLYLFPVTGILPQTVVSNSGYPVPACASGCMTKILKGAVFARIVSRNLSHDKRKSLNYQCYYSFRPDFFFFGLILNACRESRFVP